MFDKYRIDYRCYSQTKSKIQRQLWVDFHMKLSELLRLRNLITYVMPQHASQCISFNLKAFFLNSNVTCWSCHNASGIHDWSTRWHGNKPWILICSPIVSWVLTDCRGIDQQQVSIRDRRKGHVWQNAKCYRISNYVDNSLHQQRLATAYFFPNISISILKWSTQFRPYICIIEKCFSKYLVIVHA